MFQLLCENPIGSVHILTLAFVTNMFALQAVAIYSSMRFKETFLNQFLMKMLDVFSLRLAESSAVRL